MRHSFVARREDSLLLIIDFQSGMLKAMPHWEETATRVNQLSQAAGALGIPVFLTEQYPKGLGNTTPQVLEKIQEPSIMHKEHFSACLEGDFFPLIRGHGRSKIVLVGMETHVCVLQTGLDLIQAGHQVHLAADAVTSRTRENRDIAIEMFRQAGAVITSAEIVIFQWALRANTDEFRRILPIVK